MAAMLSAIVLAAWGCARKKPSEPDYIRHLDSLIQESPEFEKEKTARIEQLRKGSASATSPGEKYLFNRALFDEYMIFNSDSARKYINENLELASQTGNEEWQIESKIRKAQFLTGTGLMVKAMNILDSIDPSTLSKDALTDYYGEKIYLYSHLGNYTGGDNNSYYGMERMYRDSIMTIIDESHPQYLWFKGWDILGTDKPAAKTIEALKAKIAKSKLNTHQDAKDAYILAKLYEQGGDRDNFLRYMSLSASADVRISNWSEISSLQELSAALFNDGRGEIERPYAYTSYCLDKAIAYPNRVQAYLLSDSMRAISSAYQREANKHQQTTQAMMILAFVLTAILAGAVIYIVTQYRRLHSQQKRLDDTNRSLSEKIEELDKAKTLLNEANGRLQALIADLKEKNYELNEANYVKEEYICNIFNLCSEYISKLSDLKKSIHLKAVTKKYKEIEQETEDFDMKADFKEFYRAFDTVFLHIYPDFVHDFNELLQEDKQIIPKEGELLNTELRIYALIRLGITDSTKIAEFLHCSSQTVYNNRFKVRGRARVPKKDFAEIV